MPQPEWKKPSCFYWRKEFIHNGIPVHAEVSVELAESEKGAEDLFLRFLGTALPEVHRNFKDSCSYDLEIGDCRLKITCFRNRSVAGTLINCGIRIRPDKNKK